MKEEPVTCCVYAHVDPRDGMYHYIGSTICLNIRTRHHVMFSNWDSHTIEYCRWRMELEIAALEPILVVLCRSQPSTVKKHERAYIKAAIEAKHPLVNLENTTPQNSQEKRKLLAEYAQLRKNLGP